ncbi:MAG: prepilin-type N-terminal cleavage/methylation domain-containing protein [Deltaproteobacteria bacterium]|nr:prepilin-type N-terminal cleavage/methylation domain-containing protein [Deltaproteobacteria bacterium]
MSRGFTLLEMMVALGVSAVVVLTTAEVARYAVSASEGGGQRTELSSRVQLATTQLRSDLMRAGSGSTGAVAGNGVAWGAGGITVVSAGNAFPAIPVVRGLDNVPAGTTVGGIVAREGSDIVQLVVPGLDPNDLQLTTAISHVGTLALEAPVALPGGRACPFLYVVDHGAPNGAGRTQLLNYVPGTSGPISLLDPLAFTVSPGSEVTCARISTWWVSDNRELRRSDLLPGAAFGTNGEIFTSPNAAGISDIITPGVEDLQIAYVFSSMAPGATPGQRTFGAPAPEDYNVTAQVDSAWFEVRSVRYNILGRALRAAGAAGGAPTVPIVENRAAPLILNGRYSFTAGRGAVELTTLRMFDDSAESTLTAEPY